MAQIPTNLKKYSLIVVGLLSTGGITCRRAAGFAPDSFVRVERPVPGRPAFR